MQKAAVALRDCVHCSRPVPEENLHCSYCGAMQPLDEDSHDDGNEYRWVKIVALFYGIDIFIVAIANMFGYFRGLHWLIFTQAVLAGLTIIFSIIQWKDTRVILQWKSFRLSKALVYSVAAVIVAVIVNIIVKWLNRTLFDEDVYYYGSFRHLGYPRLSMIVMVAFIPALFEELGYRGVVLNGILKFAHERRAILISAFLFAIIHMSFISFFWLMPFAIWLGNIRVKEQTIWYGVLIHFFFNLTACGFEFYELRLW